jgi:hypothetical protein
MIRTRLFILPAIAILCTCGLRAQDPAPIPDDQFDKIHSLIKRSPDEWKWMEVPWKIRFSDAQKAAVAEGKPILIAQAAQGSFAGCA